MNLNKQFLVIILSISAHSAFGNELLLKNEAPQQDILVPSVLPSIKDKCACVQNYKAAIEKNDADAIEQVATCFSPVEKNDCNKDTVNHANWLKAAATRGKTMAQFSLGFLYNFGAGVKKDHKLAADWWAQSARQKLPAGFFMLAKAYEEGLGRKKSSAKALALYEEAQKLGYEKAEAKIKQLKK